MRLGHFMRKEKKKPGETTSKCKKEPLWVSISPQVELEWLKASSSLVGQEPILAKLYG